MPTTLGVDLGQHAVKAFSLGNGRPHAVTAARAGLEDLDALARLRAEAGVSADAVVAALSGEAVPIVFFDLPVANRKRIGELVPAAVEDVLPMPCDGHQIAYQALRVDRRRSHVVAALAEEEAISGLLGTFAAAGLDPRVVDLDLFALYTCALKLGPATGAFAVADIGATKTLLVVIADGELKAARLVPLGADAATRRIAQALDIEPDRAEELKRDLIGAVGLAGAADAMPGSESRIIGDALIDVYGDILDDVTVTVRATERRLGIDVAEVLLVGGGARPTGLVELAERRLGHPVRIPPAPAGVDGIAEIWPDAAVAYGLALRGGRQTRGSDLNFRTGAFAYGRQFRQLGRRVAPFAIPIAAVVVAALASAIVRYAGLRSEVRTAERTVAELFDSHFPGVPMLQPEKQIQQKVDEIRSRSALLEGPVSPAEVLLLLSRATPPGLEVTVDNLLLEGRRLSIRARTGGFAKIDELKDALVRSEMFENLKVEDQDRKGAEVSFRMIMDVTGGA